MKTKTLVYDIESYPNVFTCCFSDGSLFEISWRKNEIKELVQFLSTVDTMIGFNNVYFDYPLLHFIIKNQNNITSERIYKKTKSLIDMPYDEQFKNTIWPNQRMIKQIDLLLIHHFDNANRRTSLKALEFAMRSQSVEDLPFKAGKVLTFDEIDKLIQYNHHDVAETLKFYEKSSEQIKFREGLGDLFGETDLDLINFNDTKIGKEYLGQELERLNPGSCYDGKKKRQTPRKPSWEFGEIREGYNDHIPVEFHLPKTPGIADFVDPELKVPKVSEFSTERKFKSALTKYNKIITQGNKKFEKLINSWDNVLKKKHKKNLEAIWVPIKGVIFDYIRFDRPEFQEVLDFYNTLNVTHTKGDISKKCTVDGFTFSLGAGGIHGSISSRILRSDDEWVIRDVDVAGYYGAVSIKNGVFPEHLGQPFCEAYKTVANKRKTYKKGTASNKALKLSVNGAYGDFGNPHSVLYDPKCMLTITINGQLMLCMLAEQYMSHKDVQIIQVNTDGITIRFPRHLTPWIESVEKWWMDLTKLELETVEYKAMFIRDVNNYIGQFMDGKLKVKGAYDHDPEWHKNHSGLVIAKAVQAHLFHGADVEDFIVNHKDVFDFMMMGKVNRTDRLVVVQTCSHCGGSDAGGKSVSAGYDCIICENKGTEEVEQLHTIRFYFSKDGGELVKYMPPLKAKPDTIRRNAYQGSKGWKVSVCNHINDFENDLDYDYYITEAYKLIDPLKE